MAPKRARRGSAGARSQSVASSSAMDTATVRESDSPGDQIHTEEDAAERESPALPSPSLEQEDPDEVKILLATDNHVGYMERDPVRGQDSINTFREILQMARDLDVDFILLGGDLFHDNKPSRTTLHQVMGALREYTLGDRPISIELLSDPNDGQAEGYNFPAVNYEDSNLNVAIPVFSIHGNHDDPQGVGAEGALSAIDLLSVSGLLNYFGKVELPSSDNLAGKKNTQAPTKGGLSDVGIRIRPVLLRKGETKIALYGMGNIKDERMHYELRTNRVRMYRPREDPNDWFNILTIHQNRACHDPKAVVPETMFDDSVHLVVWGHEHEQLIKPQAVAGKRYHISQPGSSVATSLCPGEAAEKKVAMIRVKGRDFKLEHLPLKTVRPFVMEEIDLDEVVEQAGLQLDDKTGVTKLLKRKVKELADRANKEWDAKHANIPKDERPERMLPLVRVRIHYTRHEMGNLVRFGQDFIGKVANPRELLQFSKKKGDKADKSNYNVKEHFAEPTDDMLPAEKLEKVSMKQLVKTYLGAQSLQVLDPLGLERSVLQYVDKDEKFAIQRYVDKELKSTNSGLNIAELDERRLEAELDRIREEKNRAADEARENDNGGTGRAMMQFSDDEDEDEEEEDNGRRSTARSTAKKSTSKARGGASTRRGGRSGTAGSGRRDSFSSGLDSDDSMMMNDDGAFNATQQPRRRGAAPAPAQSTARSVAPRNGRQLGVQKGRSGGGQSTLMFRGQPEDEDESIPTPPTPQMSSRAAALMGGSTAAGKKKTGAAASKSAAPATTSRASTSRRAAAQKASTRLAESQATGGGGNGESDDDFEMVDG